MSERDTRAAAPRALARTLAAALAVALAGAGAATAGAHATAAEAGHGAAHGAAHGSAQPEHGAEHGVAAAEAPSTAAFRAANTAMHAAMDIDYTGDADVDFARGMIGHHQGAIAMAEILLEHGEDEKMRALAAEIVAAQTAEIDLIEGWLAARGE
jgi:uncharacterized protein (DUF305 family)